jgi:hypothetical protein
MSEVLSKMNGHDLSVMLTFTALALAGLVIGLTALVTYHWRGVRQFETEAALKQEMIQRGMSAEDIERVLRASAAGAPAACSTAGRGTADLLANR